MKSNILVSICIPAYNGGHLISRAIESCLNQTYTNLEIVIVDDCSSDNTVEIIKNFQSKDQRIKFFRNESNLGLALNFFETFKKSSGEYTTLRSR
jgi:glycosyltransferase involved in cell wall biosynthesis